MQMILGLLLKNNIALHTKTRIGDIERGFKEADYVFKERFQTSKQAHVCLETHSCLSSYDPYTRRLTHRGPLQMVFFTRLALSQALNMPSSKVRVICTEGHGGGFGSRVAAFPYDVCAALME